MPSAFAGTNLRSPLALLPLVAAAATAARRRVTAVRRLSARLMMPTLLICKSVVACFDSRLGRCASPGPQHCRLLSLDRFYTHPVKKLELIVGENRRSETFRGYGSFPRE